jgi:hypothetical protein
MIIYCFSGLGADKRVFDFLKLDSYFDLITIDWVRPMENETIEKYSRRISGFINIQRPFGILGVSFAGIVAQEVSSILNPNFTIIISSIGNARQIPFVLSAFPNIVLKIIPFQFFRLPRVVANYVFSAKNKNLLHQILKDTDPEFVKWAIIAFKNWKSNKLYPKAFFLSGAKDRLFKPKKGITQIENAGHFMIVDSAEVVSDKINLFLREIKIIED